MNTSFFTPTACCADTAPVIHCAYEQKYEEAAVMIWFWELSGIFLEKIQNPDYLTWFYVIVGAVVTAYCGAFMAINMDFFIKKIDTSSLA